MSTGHQFNIPFNKPYISGKELEYISDAVSRRHISGNGYYTKKCQSFFEEKLGTKKALLTTSCTDALEMCAILLDIKLGDEVIVPSYTFVSSALAFTRQGAKIIFADSRSDHPGIDEEKIESLITPKTKAIVIVHYAGVACDMDKIMKIAQEHKVYIIEDAAQAIDSYYKGKPLGSLGHLATFSFHETKNIQCGEGGLLAINDNQFVNRAEIIWEKGTNRAEFFRGEVNKYGWVDTGSSFLPSEITAAFLWGQLENLKTIQNKRIQLWKHYKTQLKEYPELFHIPAIPEYSSNNAHMFYIVCKTPKIRTMIIEYLKHHKIYSVFHYLSLHKSKYMNNKYEDINLPNSDRYSDVLLRLPMFYELSEPEISNICHQINKIAKEL